MFRRSWYSFLCFFTVFMMFFFNIFFRFLSSEVICDSSVINCILWMVSFSTDMIFLVSMVVSLVLDGIKRFGGEVGFLDGFVISFILLMLGFWWRGFTVRTFKVI